MEQQVAPQTLERRSSWEGLVCSFLQTAHQLILTFSLSRNAAESAIFHPKSHKRIISLTSYSLKGNSIEKWQDTRHIKRSQSVWVCLLCLANLQRSSWVLIVTSCSISQLGGSCCWKTSSLHIHLGNSPLTLMKVYIPVCNMTTLILQNS